METGRVSYTYDAADIYSKKENLQSFYAYYQALCNWIQNNEKIIESELALRNRLDILNRLDVLISLDLEKYLLDSNDIGLYLDKEKERIGETNFKHIDDLLEVISDTLLDMVTIYSDFECCNCKYGNMRYIKINNQDGNGKIVLECNACGQIMNTDGSVFEGEI